MDAWPTKRNISPTGSSPDPRARIWWNEPRSRTSVLVQNQPTDEPPTVGRIMESKTDRKARLRKAAGDAIVRAIETGGDPFDLMMEATGEGGNISVPYVQQHPFFSEKRHLFKTAEDRKRDREEAALAAEPGPIVWVRRQFDDHRHAAYRLWHVSDWHWSGISGGVQHRANRYYLH